MKSYTMVSSGVCYFRKQWKTFLIRRQSGTSSLKKSYEMNVIMVGGETWLTTGILDYFSHNKQRISMYKFVTSKVHICPSTSIHTYLIMP